MKVRNWGERASIAKLLERVFVLYVAKLGNWSDVAIFGEEVEGIFIIASYLVDAVVRW